MPKKIFICFFVVLLLTTMVVPAFATSSGGPGVYYKSAIVIDAVKLLNGAYAGSIVDWPNNYYAHSGSPVFADFEFVGFSCEGGSNELVTVFYPGQATSFSLRCSNIFFDDSLSFSLDNDGSDSFQVTQIVVSGNLSDLSTVDDTYNISSSYFTESFSVNSSSVDIDSLIRKAVGSFDGLGDSAWLRDVQITVHYYRSDPDVLPALCFRVNQIPDSNSFVSWFHDSHLTVKNVQEIVQGAEFPDMFDWLKNSIQSFLDLEIAPGFSLNKLFYVVLVISVLLAVVKLFT